MKAIDKVTVENLSAILKMFDINLDIKTVDKIIDVVELIEDKGDNIKLTDILILKEEIDIYYKNN